jgi:hypothetical protein
MEMAALMMSKVVQGAKFACMVKSCLQALVRPLKQRPLQDMQECLTVLQAMFRPCTCMLKAHMICVHGRLQHAATACTQRNNIAASDIGKAC